jgi:hypothetical protein
MRSALTSAAMWLALAGCAGGAPDSGTSTPEPSLKPQKTFTVSGFVTAHGSFATACKGVGRSADLHSGTRVVVRGAAGAALAGGVLEDGFADDDEPQRRCIFPFTVMKVPEGRGPFTVQVAQRTAVPFTRKQAGQVGVTLG